MDKLSNLGGSTLAANFGALSVGHLEYLDPHGIQALAQRGVVATLLSTPFYFLKETKLPPVAALHKAGVAMAADFLIWHCAHPAELSYMVGVEMSEALRLQIRDNRRLLFWLMRGKGSATIPVSTVILLPGE